MNLNATILPMFLFFMLLDESFARPRVQRDVDEETEDPTKSGRRKSKISFKIPVAALNAIEKMQAQAEQLPQAPGNQQLLGSDMLQLQAPGFDQLQGPGVQQLHSSGVQHIHRQLKQQQQLQAQQQQQIDQLHAHHQQLQSHIQSLAIGK